MVAFETVVVVVCVISAVVAVAAFIRGRRLYDHIGRLGRFSMSPETELDDSARELVREEVRQMLDAISALREARGEQPLQVKGEQPPEARDGPRG